MRKDHGAFAFDPRPREDERVSVTHLFMAAAAALIAAWIIGGMTTSAITQHVAKQINTELEAF